MLYDDTDRPKALHSKMLLSDVMQERVTQMDYAHQIKALKKQQDDAFLVQQSARLKVRHSSCCMHPQFNTRQSQIMVSVSGMPAHALCLIRKAALALQTQHISQSAHQHEQTVLH